MNKIKKTFRLVLDDIARFFPYFFGFYIFSLLVSLFSRSWKSFFNWEAFAVCVVALGVASLFSNKGWTLSDLIFLKQEGKAFILRLWKQLGISGQIKIAIILAILIFALTKNIGVIDFIVLAYALASVLFILESRISAGLAIVLLVACPLFLMFKKDAVAETLAVYAYYFLVITVITQIASLTYPQAGSTTPIY